MKTRVEFRSAAFPPYDGEEDEINPGVFGKRFAEFLVRGLSKKGFRPLKLSAEDWGWVIPIENDGFRLWIGCANQDESPDGFSCFIEPHTPTIRKYLIFGRVDTSARVMALQQAIDEILAADPSIADKHWWSHEEYNGSESEPKRGT